MSLAAGNRTDRKADLAASRLPRGKARAHTRVVKFFRIALPVVMVAVVATLIVLVSGHALKRGAAQRDAETPIRMINPHFFGRDNLGRAYTLGAREASRDQRTFQRVILAFPTITLDVGGPHPSTLTADRGVYREDSRMLYLAGHVRANDPKASSFATDQAVVNTRTGTVTGPAALASQTDVGVVNSKSFDVYDKGNKVIFKGGVHARLNRR
jgi:lipopolysaccharide export system protein LptC